MTRTGALYANRRLLAKNCTSFILTPAHIIFTTTQHLLKFVHITNVEGMEQAEQEMDTLKSTNSDLQIWKYLPIHKKAMSDAEALNVADG
jgi:hypothetical protein